MEIQIDKQAILEIEYDIVTDPNYLGITTIKDEHKLHYVKEILEYFESIEDYEKCSKIKVVLDQLES